MTKTRATSSSSSSQQVKGSVGVGMSSNRVAFELKRKVVVALNKVADRDTYQLGIQQLEAIVDNLTPDGVYPFLSCVMDTDSEQKNTVRKECVRLMGNLASLYPRKVVNYVGKMVMCIVKRLKDPDSVVRDACVETIGIMASKLGSDEEGGDGVFVLLMKPLFEALGEQNKQLQSGSALCLSKVIDCTLDPPVAILQQMLSRTIKLLKNPHFVAKPAVIQLNTSIIKAGGAPSQTLLSAAMQSIQEALKSSDWNTRKAASVALGDIASIEDPMLEFHRASCIHGLESCRFDKVKPVRETVLQAIKYWQRLPLSSTPGYSPQTSSLVRGESLCEDRDVSGSTSRRAGGDSSKTKLSFSERTPCPNLGDKPQHVKKISWLSEMGVLKSPNAPATEIYSERSVKSSISSILIGTDSIKFNGNGSPGGNMRSLNSRNDSSPHDGKYQFLSTTNFVDGYCKSKLAPEKSSLPVQIATEKSDESSPQSAIDDVSSVNQSCLTKLQDRNSFDSNVTDSQVQVSDCCCLQTANSISSMKKHLLDIDNKQSAILDLLKVLSNSTTNSLALTQSKVDALGNSINQIAASHLHEGRYSENVLKFSRINSSGESSYLPSPSPSDENNSSKLPSRTSNKFRLWEQNNCKESPKINMSMQAISIGYLSDNLKNNVSNRTSVQKKITVDHGIDGEFDSFSGTLDRCASGDRERQHNDNIWRRVMDFVSKGDLESAYAEALCSENELLLVKLLDRSGPALEYLTRNTANNLLTVLVAHLHQRKNIQTVIPWIRQIVDLSSTHGMNYIGLPVNFKKELLMAIREAAIMTSPLQKISLSQLHARLHLLWGQN